MASKKGKFFERTLHVNQEPQNGYVFKLVEMWKFDNSTVCLYGYGNTRKEATDKVKESLKLTRKEFNGKKKEKTS